MNETINLLIHEAPKPSQSIGLKRFRLLAVGSFFLTLLVSIVFLLLIVFSPLPGLIQEKNTLIQQIPSEKFFNITSLSNRLTNISGVLDQRPIYDSLMATLQKQIPEGAQLHTVKMTGKAITFGVTSSSLAFIDQFIVNVKTLNEQGKRLFRTMTLTSLTYNNTQNIYVLTVDMTLL